MLLVFVQDSPLDNLTKRKKYCIVIILADYSSTLNVLCNKTHQLLYGEVLNCKHALYIDQLDFLSLETAQRKFFAYRWNTVIQKIKQIKTSLGNGCNCYQQLQLP